MAPHPYLLLSHPFTAISAISRSVLCVFYVATYLRFVLFFSRKPGMCPPHLP